jgi:hypothetical protein
MPYLASRTRHPFFVWRLIRSERQKLGNSRFSRLIDSLPFQAFQPFNRFAPFKRRTKAVQQFNRSTVQGKDKPDGELRRFENSQNVEMIDHANRLEA